VLFACQLSPPTIAGNAKREVSYLLRVEKMEGGSEGENVMHNTGENGITGENASYRAF
jgi:hypothetical protein